MTEDNRTVFLHNDDVHLVLIEETDAPTLLRGMNDTGTTRFLNRVDMPTSLDFEREWVRGLYTSTNKLVLGIWMVESQKLIGTISLNKLCYRNGTAILGIAIFDTTHHGRGIGTSAITMLLEHAFTRMNLRAVKLSVFSHNARALRCYKRCGFEVVGTIPNWVFVDGKYRDEIIMVVRRRRAH